MASADEYWDKSAKLASEYSKSLENQAKSGKSKKKQSAGIRKPTDTRTFADIAAANGDDKNWFLKAIETPVIKGALNAISTGAYSSANYALRATDTEKDQNQRLQEAAKTGDKLAIAQEIAGNAGFGGAIGAGLIKGLSAGFGQNENDATLYHDVIKQAQGNNGIDTESKESKAVQGIGGFIGDVALDPSLLIGGGAAFAGIKGATAGARDAGIAARTAKLGGQIGEETSRLKGAVQGAKKEINEFRWDEYERSQAKLTKKEIKKQGNKETVSNYKETIPGYNFLPEKLLTGEAAKLSTRELQRAAKKERLFRRGTEAEGKTAQEATELISKLVGGKIHPQVAEAGLKSVAKASESAPVGMIDNVEGALAKPEPKTVGETVMTEAAPKAAVKAPDVTAVIPAAKIIDDIPSELKVGNYQNYTPVDRFVMGTEYLTVPKARIDKATGETVVKHSGQFTDIFKGMKSGLVAPDDTEKFHTFMKSFAEDEALTLDDAISKAQEFVKTNSVAIQKSSRSFAPTAINGRLTNLNKAAGKDASIGILRSLPSEKVEQYRRPLPPEQSEALLGETLEKTRDDIINGVFPLETAKVLDEVFTKHFTEYSKPSGPFKTNSGWGTNTKSLIDGDPKIETWWTTNSAIDLFTKLNSKISGVLKIKGVKGPEYHKIKDDMFMRVAANIDVTLKGHGIFPYLTNVMPDGGTAIRASMYDVLEAMGPELRQTFIHVPKNTPTNLMVTQAMDVGEMLMRSMIGYDGAGKLNFAVIKPDVIRALKGEYRNLADEKGIVRAIEENLDPSVQRFNAGIVEANIKGYRNAVKARNTVYSKFFEAFTKLDEAGSSPMIRLGETVLKNTSLHSTHMSKVITTASDEALRRLTKALEVGSVGAFHKQIADIVPVKSVHNPEVAKVLNQEIAKVKREFATPREEILVNAQEALVKVAAEPVTRKQQLKTAKLNRIQAARTTDARLNPDALDDALEGGTDAVIELARKDHAWDVTSRLYPLQKMFNRTFGMRRSYAAVTSGLHLGTHLETAFHEVLNGFTKNFNSEQINQAFKTIQAFDGDIVKYMDDMPQHGFAPEVVEMSKLMNAVFDTSTNNFYARNGVGADHMNSILSSMTHVPDNWRFGSNLSPAEMAMEWKKWENIKNPLNALAAVHTAMVKASDDISMGAKYSHFFGANKPPVGEASKWAKIDNSKGTNAFAKLIDTDLYYPKEIIAELPALGKMITESRTFKNEFLQKWTSQVFDPITSALKLTQTTMKPGHHVMSLQGDLLRNSLAGMNFSTKEYKASWRILRARRKMVNELSGLDQYARLKGIGGAIAAEDSGVKGIGVLVNGKSINVRDEDIYRLFEQKDIYLPIHSAGVAEDLLTTPTGGYLAKEDGTALFQGAARTAQGINKGVTKLTNNRVIKLNKFSAERDNWMRGALALHFMQSRNFKSIEEAMDFAATQVKKWAPTAKDLTAIESKSARRVVFYYTWLRGILPRVVESSIRRPGWATMPSKAMYNLAVANGIDPLSLGDPFPEDIETPDYYRNTVLGPTFKDDEGDYWGYNPTSPVMDVMNSLGSGVSVSNLTRPFAEDSGEGRIARTLMGMIHPAFRSPIELGMGQSLSTGAPIVDSGQYLTDMIGPARYASKVVGHTLSPNGIIPRRTEAKFREGIAEDDWANNAALETWNYSTGSQTKNYTSDAATKAAEYDKKEKEQKANKESTRTEWWK
jgi:hypothetical protein